MSIVNLLYLKYFYDAAALQSVSQAARKNFVSQSALSQGIAKLETSLGVSVTIHKRQKFILTEEGKVVFEQAREIFQSVRNLQDRLNQAQNKVQGELHFVCTNSLGMSFVPDAYLKAQKLFPDLTLKFRLGGLTFIETWLRQGIAEFGIVINTKVFEEYDKRILAKGEFRLYKRRDRDLDLGEGIFVDEEEDVHVAQLKELYHKKYRKPLKIRAELSSWEVVSRFIDRNIGIGFFPDYIERGNRFPNLEVIDLGLRSIVYEIIAIYPKGERLSIAANAFLDQF